MCGSDDIKRIIIPPVVAQKIASKMNSIYLRKCPCRASRRLCSPDSWEVCLLFEDAAPDNLLEGHLITQQEALLVLQRMAAQKAIHNLFFRPETGEITELCSCCTCCCKPLQRLKEKGNYAEEARAGYEAITDELLCNRCGDCLDSCYFEARYIKDGMVSLMTERCFGCGRCVANCSQEAIRLAIDPSQSHPILTRIELL